MPFDKKKWLDSHVVPLIEDNDLRIHSFIWNGNPPEDILVWLRIFPAGGDDDPKEIELDPMRWAVAVKELLEQGWRFDFTREQQLVNLTGGVIKAFGGDGAPVFNKEGMASVRLFHKQDDGIGLILQIGCQFWSVEGLTAGMHAAAAVKGFFGLFDTENPLEVCAKYGASFGMG